MCSRVERYFHAKKSCITVKYAGDDRYNHLSKSGGIVNHGHIEYSRVPVVVAKLLADVEDAINISGVDVIGIDEGQFYADAPEMVSKWVRAGKIVIISALDTTFEGKPFGRIAELVSLADRVEKLSAVCMKCGSDALYSERISGGTQIESIGGNGAYLSVCRRCFIVYTGE